MGQYTANPYLAAIACLSMTVGISIAAGQSDADQLQKQLDDAIAGSVIEVPDGIHRLSKPLRITKSGTEVAPIIIRAKNRGKAVLDGQAGIEATGVSYVTIEGFAFVHDNYTPAVRLTDCHHMQITRNRFRLSDTLAKRQNWVAIGGGESHHNRIDHNLFEDKEAPGSFIAIDGSEKAPYKASQHDRIDFNHFRRIAARKGGGARAIRIGWTRLADADASTVVENNLFDKCDGDAEMITVRTCKVVIRHNTIENCGGYVTLRAGKSCTVEGNFFFGDNKAGVGGVRLHGSDHKLFNNYFEGMTVPALILSNGVAEADGNRVPRPAPQGAVIVFNTWVNCLGGAMTISDNHGGRWTAPPQKCTIANNIVIGYGPDLIKMHDSTATLTWLSNIMYHAGAKPGTTEKIGLNLPDTQVRVTFPKLRKPGRIWRIHKSSPAVDAAVGDYAFVTTDIDGQPRGKQRDIGADEYELVPVKQSPLIAENVGVNAP